MESVHDIVRRAEENYLTGTTKLGEYVDWSMHDTIETVDAYLNSKHISGPKDSLGRDKPFFNIVTAAVNIWYRATDIDRKDIKFIPNNSSSVVLAFVANVILQNWMNKQRFGTFLNEWGRALARYGSVVTKFVEKDGQLTPSVIPWNRFIADPVQFDALPRIEKFYMTPAQLRRNKAYDQDVVDQLINAKQSRETIGGQKKDNMSDFIELYEVHGELDSRLLDKEPDEKLEDKDIQYVQQMHVISFMETSGDKGYEDFCLFKGREKRDPYMITHLIQEDGRTLSIGAVEYLFDAQWMMNHTIKNMKDTLDIASKLVFQTADSNFVGKNVLSAIETGDIFVHAADKPLTRLANDKPDITALQNFGTQWHNLSQEVTSTPDSLRGNTLPSGTPYALGSLLAQQSSSLFELMTENKGLHIEDMMRDYIIPHIRKQLKNSDEIVAILDDAGIQEIDSMYIPAEAVRRYNEQTINKVLNDDVAEPFDPLAAQQSIKQEMGQFGNKRFFVPSEIDSDTWDQIFSDFAWDNIRVEVTNEQSDKQAVLSTLSSVLKDIISNPAALQDPNAKTVFNAILTETGRISPLQIATSAAQPPMAPTAPQVDMGGMGGGLPTTNIQ